MEDILGFTSRRRSHAGGDGGLGGSLPFRLEREGVRKRAEEGEATGMSEARSSEGAMGPKGSCRTPNVQNAIGARGGALLLTEHARTCHGGPPKRTWAL